MAEFIDRSKLEFDFRQCNRTDSNWTPQRVVQMIHRQPAADVAQVVHGRWIIVDTEKGKGVCSNCNRQDSIDPLATHCRFCGARMDLEVMDNGQK